MFSGTFRGRAAELRWGYLRAASLGSWTLTADLQGLTMTAAVTASDAFRLSQPALTFCVTRQIGTPWIWGVSSLQIAGSTVTAKLIAQETHDGTQSVCAAGVGTPTALGR